MLNFRDFIQAYVLSTKHHLNMTTYMTRHFMEAPGNCCLLAIMRLHLLNPASAKKQTKKITSAKLSKLHRQSISYWKFNPFLPGYP